MGKLKPKWLTFDKFEPDTSADAILLADIGDSEIQFAGNQISTLLTIHKRYKVLSDLGVEAGDFNIYYPANGGSISNIDGYTYNMLEDGEVEKVRLNKKDIFSEDVNENTKSKKWAMPKLRAGSVFEITYTLRFPGARVLDWSFESKYPSLMSQYEISHPKFIVLALVGRGNLLEMKKKTDTYTNNVLLGGGERSTIDFERKTYTLYNILPLKKEPFSTALSDYQASLTFILKGYDWPNGAYESALPSWEKLAEDMLSDDDFGKVITANARYKKWIKDKALDLSGNKDLAHAMKIYHTVQKEFEWDGRYRRYKRRSFSELFNEGKASSGEINLILTGLYRHLGFEAHPAILSTRSNGEVFGTYPLFNQFNHNICLVKVGDQYINLDASDKYCRFGMLPYESLNGSAFLLIEENPQWIKLAANFPQIESTMGSVGINDEGMLNLSLSCYYKSAESCRMREAYEEKKTNDNTFVKRAFFGKKSDEISLDEAKVNGTNPEKPFKIDCKLETDAFIDQVGEFIYLEPMLGTGFNQNPLSLSERTYPVDFARPMQWEHSISFQVPSGYEIESLPETVQMALPNKGGSFVFQSMQSGPFIQLKSVVIIKQTKFEPNEYGNIKTFFDHITAKHGEQIVLKKSTK
ncbi:MAG: DUF3857 domain-containing protein [Bacteroidia bacterium]|nr:DUF3857 domain-containing protein [Bacteroidia bacterium]